jgi:hypothetical protein
MIYTNENILNFEINEHIYQKKITILGLHKQDTADKKQVVLQASHCRSSSGINSKQTRSPSVAPFK